MNLTNDKSITADLACNSSLDIDVTTDQSTVSLEQSNVGINGEEGEKYHEFIGKISDVQVGDEVIGSDGQWHEVVQVFEPFMPKLMYRFMFGESQDVSLGYIDCTGEHQWTLYDADVAEGVNGFIGTVKAADCPVVLLTFLHVRVGSPDGPYLLSIESITPVLSQCITVDSEDHQFEALMVPVDPSMKQELEALKTACMSQ